jgi:hypothetical protein
LTALIQTTKVITMNIIKTGEYYRIFDDGIQVGKCLDAATYEVVFVPNQGFFLKLLKAPDVRETKVYGRMRERIEKVMRSYSASTRNMGVILSGAKGIGKSLFAKLISRRVIEEGLPVIMVNDYFEGLPQFLASIDQKCMVLFDEFDKNFFDPSRDTEDHTSVQDSFLTLFDGVYASNKLFVITANSLGRLSEFLVNRPGRFRYHIRFAYPDEDEIRQFLRDKLGTSVRAKEIDDVVKFSTIVPLSYDCLTAIAAELEMGESFESCLEMLNIINVTGSHYYSGLVKFESGEELRVSWVGSYNFFDRNADPSIIHLEVYGLKGMRSVEIGSLAMRQGDVRRCGRFLQDGSIVIPYDDGKSFKWALKRSEKGRKADCEYAKPAELILTSNDGYRQVSFKDLV